MTTTEAQNLIDACYSNGLITRETASEANSAIRSSWLGMALNNSRRAAMLRARFGLSA